MKIDIVYGEFDHLADIEQKQTKDNKKGLFINEQKKRNKNPLLVNFDNKNQAHNCISTAKCQQFACAGSV